MNIFLHSLLVTNKMDNFTVTEAKDALLREHTEFINSDEARRFIYRQLFRNIEKGLLKRIDSPDGDVTKVIYSKTDKYFSSDISSKKQGANTKKIKPKIANADNFKKSLEKELVDYELDLSSILEEVKEYKRLSSRFPELKKTLQQCQHQAKERSTKVIGKVNALQNLLGNTIIKNTRVNKIG